MANSIRIKRRASGAAGAPSSLLNAEVAFNEVDDVLYYGKGTGGAGGTASSTLAIAGPGAYLTLTGVQTVSGAKTFTGAVILQGETTATTQSTSDDSTKLATTAYVKAQSYLTAATGVTSVGLALPNIFSVSGSPVTTTGSLTAALVNQDANVVLAGPVSGGAAVPSFRALVAGDIPTLTASKISDFDTQVRTSRLDQMSLPSATVNFNGQRLSNLTEPTDPTDAATKAYVDASRLGLDVKDSVRVATTGNITLSGVQTIDGVTLVAGDRVLVKNQSTASTNGIYVVASGAWNRALDFNASQDVTSGAFTFVEAGTANADSGWVLSTLNPITVGTTALSFVQFSGAGQIDAGDGLSKSGNRLDVGAGTGIAVTATTVALTGQALALHNLASNGLFVRTGAGTVTARSVAASGNGVSVTNGNGVSGNPTLALSAALASVGGLTPAADRIAYYTGASTAALSTLTAFGRSLIDDADAAAGRSTLGLGSIATQNANNVAITGGTLSGITIDGGTFAFIMGISTLVLHQIMSMGAVGC
jgi:hypothetical protein